MDPLVQPNAGLNNDFLNEIVMLLQFLTTWRKGYVLVNSKKSAFI